MSHRRKTWRMLSSCCKRIKLVLFLDYSVEYEFWESITEWMFFSVLNVKIDLLKFSQGLKKLSRYVLDWSCIKSPVMKKKETNKNVLEKVRMNLRDTPQWTPIRGYTSHGRTTKSYIRRFSVDTWCYLGDLLNEQ